MCGREKYVACGLGVKSGNRKGEEGRRISDEEDLLPFERDPTIEKILGDPLHSCG
jgi:hypothetical protein